MRLELQIRYMLALTGNNYSKSLFKQFLTLSFYDLFFSDVKPLKRFCANISWIAKKCRGKSVKGRHSAICNALVLYKLARGVDIPVGWRLTSRLVTTLEASFSDIIIFHVPPTPFFPVSPSFTLLIEEVLGSKNY